MTNTIVYYYRFICQVKTWILQLVDKEILKNSVFFEFAVRIIVKKEGCLMPRKGENIYKRKDGRWEGRYIKGRTTDGKARYGYVYGKAYREVKAKLNGSSNTDYTLGVVNPETYYENTLLKEIAESWFASIQSQIKESTKIKYHNLLNVYLLPELGELTLTDLTRERIEAYCYKLQQKGGIRGKGLSAKTVSDILVLLRNILRFAVERGKIPACDARSIQVRGTSKEMRVLSRAEQERLCRQIYSDLNAKNIGILICLFTGLRVGEICALRWEDISISEKTIHVHQTMQRIHNDDDSGPKSKVIVTTPKSRCSIRTIPIPDDIASVIIDFRQSKNGYFLTGQENKYIEPRTMQNHFKRLLKKCAIDSSNFHALRHTFATRCVELGFDVKTLSEILGHASVNITMNRYVHPSMELKRENMQRLTSLIAVK